MEKGTVQNKMKNNENTKQVEDRRNTELDKKQEKYQILWKIEKIRKD